MVEFGLAPDGRWPIDVAGLATAAAEAGFAAVGLTPAHVESVPDVAKELDRHDVRCHDLMALIVTDDADVTLATARDLATAAAAARAPWVLTTFTVVPDRGLLSRCAEAFAEVGARMAVEFSPLGPVPTLGDALELLDAVGPDRSGVIIDTWHFFHGASTWGQLASMPLESIASVQFTDAPAPIYENPLRETLHRRTMPGDGTLALGRFADALRGRGYDGLVSVEVLNAELRELPIPEFARRAYQSTARYWR